MFTTTFSISNNQNYAGLFCASKCTQLNYVLIMHAINLHDLVLCRPDQILTYTKALPVDTLTEVMCSLKNVEIKQPAVSAAITLKVNANIVFARDRNVFIMTIFLSSNLSLNNQINLKYSCNQQTSSSCSFLLSSTYGLYRTVPI